MEVFEYSIIRYVPQVEREEFINIGVIVFSKRFQFLDVKYQVDTHKVSVIGEEEHLPLISNYMNSWKLICKGDESGGSIARQDIAYRFRWLVAARSTIIQASRPHPGRCNDPAKVLEDLFSKYVK
ncbi:DUF3037 domain-containing protein [Portibacter marinus]|uniref:DUF3037 domain-containing protein n=1 Tax=Portibacter marinus TaxID=2898660 RepID=UPI001F317FE6|nr:DUF3037 domain-containing protein [Portibacter marinus]